MKLGLAFICNLLMLFNVAQAEKINLSPIDNDMEDVVSLLQTRHQRYVECVEVARKKEALREANKSIANLKFALYKQRLGQLESSNRYDVVNRYGYAGKYQIHPKYFKRFGYQGTTEEFLTDPLAQEKVIYNYTRENYRLIKYYGLLKYVGTDIGGYTVTLEGLLAGAHLIGAKGLYDAIERHEGGYDGNNTHFTKYISKFC